MEKSEDIEQFVRMYAGYSLPVLLYHYFNRIFLFHPDFTEAERSRQHRASFMAKTVILFAMSDEEYEELQDSMKGVIAQARIQLKGDREFLKTVFDPELIDTLRQLSGS